MKKGFYLLLSLLFVTLTVFVLKPVFYKNKLPNVSYYNLDNDKVRLKSIELSSKETFIYYINPTCNNCFKINDDLSKTNRKLTNVIVIASFFKDMNYKEYKRKFNLAAKDVFLIDINNTFLFDFNIGPSFSLPLLIKLDKNGNRVKG